MRYCQNPEKCKSYPVVDFFIPLYCEWQKIYSLKKSHLYSSVLVPKQIQSEKQRYKNRYQLIKVENSKKKHKINELQKMRKFLIAKEEQLKIKKKYLLVASKLPRRDWHFSLGPGKKGFLTNFKRKPILPKMNN